MSEQWKHHSEHWCSEKNSLYHLTNHLDICVSHFVLSCDTVSQCVVCWQNLSPISSSLYVCYCGFLMININDTDVHLPGTRLETIRWSCLYSNYLKNKQLPSLILLIISQWPHQLSSPHHMLLNIPLESENSLADFEIMFSLSSYCWQNALISQFHNKQLAAVSAFTPVLLQDIRLCLSVSPFRSSSELLTYKLELADLSLSVSCLSPLFPACPEEE